MYLRPKILQILLGFIVFRCTGKFLKSFGTYASKVVEGIRLS